MFERGGGSDGFFDWACRKVVLAACKVESYFLSSLLTLSVSSIAEFVAEANCCSPCVAIVVTYGSLDTRRSGGLCIGGFPQDFG